MTSPRTEIDARPDRAAEKPPRTTLTVTQVAAGALAAVSAAVVASFFGVAGTVIGAALVSIVSTVGSALYSASLSATTERLRRTREAPADGAATRELPAHLQPRRAPASRRRPRWTRVAVYAVAVFVTAMAVVTGIELVGQKPVSALVGGTDGASSATTIGELSTASSGSDVPPADTGPAAPTTDAPATGTPGEDAPDGTGSPDGTGTPDDTDGPATPTGEPEESAPATPTGDPDTGDGDTDSGETAPAEPSTQAPQEDVGTGPGA